MSKTIQLGSPAQSAAVLKSHKIVVIDFYADWCGPCKTIAPIFESLAQSLSSADVAFCKVNTEIQTELAQQYSITSLPTFIIFKQSSIVERIQGVDAKKLQEVIRKLVAEVQGGGAGFASSSGSGSGTWRKGDLPRGYNDVTDQVDTKGLELLNADSDFGSVRVLFDDSKPTALANGKAHEGSKDWVESDTDEQLMLYIPFMASIKVHTLQITSLPPASDDEDDDDERRMRPKTVQLYPNTTHILGFSEAEDVPAAQKIIISESDWDATGTATIPLRFVKFQNVTSLVLFVVDGVGEGDTVRLDRVRIIGEAGEKRDQGKLEKIDHDH